MNINNPTNESWRDVNLAGTLSLGLIDNVDDYFKHNKIRYLFIDFDAEDWKALFLGLLNCPAYKLSESNEVNRQRFEKHLSEYPMLGRIFDMFEYALYEKIDVGQLREECLRLKSIASFIEASGALEKLIEGCNQATSNESALLMVPD